ncbi:MAG: DUF2975 domain-containing protein [Eubacterium sp.]
MSKKSISISVKSMIVLLVLTGIACCIMMNRIINYILPGFSGTTHYCWLIFIITCAVPCFCALIPAWIISSNIRDGKSFCLSNVKHMKEIGILMTIDTILVFVMNIVFYILKMSFPALFVAFFLIFAIFFSISVCAFALSSLIRNASELQDQSDLTI